MIFRSAKVGSAELRVIEAIGKMYKSLRYALSKPSRWSGVLRRNTFARAIRGSNSIEGYLVTVEDAIAAAEGEPPLSAEEESWSAVVGYRNAMTYVLQLAQDPNFVFNEGYLRSLHFMMVQHDLSKRPGNWRTGAIFVRDQEKNETVYEGAPAASVPKLIEELVSYLRSPEDGGHLLVKGAMAHLNLTMIHPFADGNGRMARCLQTLVMACEGVVDPTFCSIEEYLGRNTRDYYEVLAEVGKGKWSPQSDTRRWIRFNLTAHYRQAATALRRTRMIAKLWDTLEKEIDAIGMPQRIIYALSDAAVGYHVRSIHYRHLAEVSQVVASRDLRAAVENGLLVPTGERRGRVYVASERIRNVASKIRDEEPGRIGDPFTEEFLITG